MLPFREVRETERDLQAPDLPLPGGAVPEVLARLCHAPGAAGLDLGEAVLLDVETTGLGRGPGTYAFLIGLLDHCQGRLRLRQLLMPHPGEESALLERLTRALRGCSLLVTFNGRSFDLPLLQVRYQLQRQLWPLGRVPHLDLIGPARRLFRLRLGGASLARLETGLLGVERQGDIPGHEIPEAYRTFLQTGDPEVLEPVLEHNARDLVSLCALAGRLLQAFADADGSDHPADSYCLGRCYEAARLPESAERFYTAALAAAGRSDDLLHVEAQTRARRALSLLHKRRGDWPAALALWQQAIAPPGPRPYYAFEELAKHHEHRAHDPRRALEVVDEALSLLRAGRLVDRRDLHALAGLLGRRRDRLLRKRDRLRER